MNNSTKVKQYIEKELKQGVETGQSWHNDFKDSAYIFVGGLNYDLNEGDISTVFSQWGQIVDLRLVRDKKTGRSKGYCFLAYEDQRSTVLAVENFNQINLCGRIIGVNHVSKYKPPREYLELKEEGTDFLEDNLYKPSGPDGRGWGEFRDFTEEELLMIEEEKRLTQIAQERTEKAYENIQTMKDKKYFLDEDERWEQFFMEENEDNKLEKKLEDIKKEQEQLLKGIIKGTKDKKEKKEKKDKKKKKDKKNDSEKSDKKSKKDKKIKKDKKEKKNKQKSNEDD
ncbi:hypothetical protein ABPG74_012889 [Tetrahymena malaccensis]